MKFCDILKLVRHEYRYEKPEWVLSLILQGLIFISVFFLLTIACDMDRIGSEYISPLYPDGYAFFLRGYGEQDIPELEKMGFHDIEFSSEGSQGYGVTDELNGVWLCKLRAALSGKDIWNTELEEILSVIFFGQITFGAIGIVMLIIMLNNLSNSFVMKLMGRKNYIHMLKQLGCADAICRRIYYGFFSVRTVLALIFAVGANMFLIHLLNGFMAEKMYIPASFPLFQWTLVAFIGLSCMCLMWISFWKQWRRIDEG